MGRLRRRGRLLQGAVAAAQVDPGDHGAARQDQPQVERLPGALGAHPNPPPRDPFPAGRTRTAPWVRIARTRIACGVWRVACGV
eukprot:128184-Prymnesium_polylepis.2